MENSIYDIILNNGMEIVVLATVSYKDIAEKVFEMYKEMYKNSIGITITLKETKKKRKLLNK